MVYGFREKWIWWIMACISIVTYLDLINGTPEGHIIPERGLRQGYHLSLYLFFLCAEVCQKLGKIWQCGYHLYQILELLGHVVTIFTLLLRQSGFLFVRVNTIRDIELDKVHTYKRTGWVFLFIINWNLKKLVIYNKCTFC